MRVKLKRTFPVSIKMEAGTVETTCLILSEQQMQELELKMPKELVKAALVSLDNLELENEDGELLPADKQFDAFVNDVELSALLYDAYLDAWQKKALPQTWQKLLAPSPSQPTATASAPS